MYCAGERTRRIPLFCAAFMLVAPGAEARAPDVTIDDARITGGKLVVSGKTRSGGMAVRLDGGSGRAFNTSSDRKTKAFQFEVVYHPGDCVIVVQRVLGGGKLGKPAEAVVADCGQEGVAPRGPWRANVDYARNDLVTSDGSTWRAERANRNAPPTASRNDWEMFAAKGGEGAEGPAGPQGPAGPPGVFADFTRHSGNCLVEADYTVCAASTCYCIPALCGADEIGLMGWITEAGEGSPGSTHSSMVSAFEANHPVAAVRGRYGFAYSVPEGFGPTHEYQVDLLCIPTQ
jgi:hypothetical protein